MNRTAQIRRIRGASLVVGGGMFVIVLLALVAGCSNVTSTLTGGQAVAFSNASRQEERARALEDEAERRQALEEAYQSYLDVIKTDPSGNFADRARYAAALIQKELTVPGGKNYDVAIQLLQEAIDNNPIGYVAGLARSEIAAIRKNRQTIADSRRIFDNTPENADSKRRLLALNSLRAVARSYESLRDYDSAIETYRRVREIADKWTEKEGDEFYKIAAQAQFQIGNIYFYNRYNYVKGWPEYTAVIENYPKAFESDQAATLLKRAKAALDQIAEDQAYIRSKRKQKASEYIASGRRVNPNELYGVYQEQVAQTYLAIAQTWERDPLRNLPAAIKNYRLLVNELWSEMFVASDGMFQIGRLYQDNGQYQKAIAAYGELFDRFPQSFRRGEAVYNRAVAYETIREFATAYREYKAAMSLGEETTFYRAAEQKVRQFEADEDGDGYMFYQEQQAGTSDKDPNSYPGMKAVAKAE